MTNQRYLLVSSKGFKTRTETFEGREHLVVPVVALVEGVVHAMNASAPELVTEEQFSKSVAGWNGRPIFEGHPLKNGRPVSGNLPDVLAEKRVGIVFNSGIKDSKLVMEAWLDVELCEERAPELLKRAQDEAGIEISVGAFVETTDKKGRFNGKAYSGAWGLIIPDHLALLPEGDLGACSREMGCGVRAAKGAADMKFETPEEVTAAIAADPSKRKCIVAAAYKAGETFVAQLPEDWRRKSDSKNASFFARVMAAFRAEQAPEQMSGNDLMRKLNESLRELEGNSFGYVDTFYPVTGPNRVVYTCYEPSLAGGYNGMELFERGFSLDGNGLVTLSDVRIEVEPVITYEPVALEPEPAALAGKRNSAADQKKIQDMHDHSVYLGAACAPMAASEPKAAAGHCGCGGDKQPITIGEDDMTKEQVAEFLKTATAEVKAELGFAPVAPVVTPAAEPVVAAAAPKTPTFDELLATASADVRETIQDGLKAAASKKTSTIAALKATGRCPYSDEELAKMQNADLDRLVALAGPTVRAAIDFGAQGAPKTDATVQDVPAPADLGAAIKAARGRK